MGGLADILAAANQRNALARRREPLDVPFDPARQIPRGMTPPLKTGDVASVAIQNAPGIGDVASLIEAYKAWKAGDTMGGVLSGMAALPMVGSVKAYHGSKSLGADWLDNTHVGKNQYRYADSELGHFASANPKTANEFAGAPLERVMSVRQYGPQAAGLKHYRNITPKEPVDGAAVYPLRVDLKNPKELTAAEYRRLFFDQQVDPSLYKEALIKQGHDGIKVKGDPRSEWGELRSTNYIAFDAGSFIPWFERK